ncbi:ATP-binding cassette domain-containing protein [candidate division GN15 bacterium]|nr:ATP-binding cassette domain-containing protein [candidate division GN15 bacterium]
MNLYARTFSVFKDHWQRIVAATFSAALHAIFAGALVWMVGPLLMTLFQAGQADMAPTEQTAPAEQAESLLPGNLTLPEDDVSFVTELKVRMKRWVYAIVEADTREGMLVNFCILMVAIGVLKNLFVYLQGFWMAFVQQSIIRRFRNQLFEKYQRLSLDYFHRRRTGQIISRVTNDVLVLNESLEIGFTRATTSALQVLLMLVFLFILSWELTLLSLVIMPVLFGFIWFLGKKLRKYSGRTQEKMADVNSVLEEAVNNMRIVKAFSMERYEMKRFFASTYDFFRSLLRMTRIRHLNSPINDTLATAAGAMIVLFAGTKILTETSRFDVGDFMTFLLALFSMIQPVKVLSSVHVKIQEGMAAAERIFRVMDEEERVTEPKHPVSVNRFTDNIVYDQVRFSYTGREMVLQDISFEVKVGEVVAIVGPSGAGKSTLLDLLPRFYDPQGGMISIDGIDIRKINLSSLRGLMGIVTQETYLFNDTVMNNIAYGIDNASREKVEEAARMANAHRFIAELPEKYETVVGNRGIMLSGGQKQRIAIARALLKNPQILIFDEATSALDTESELLVQEAIDRLMEDRTALVVAHRLSTIKNADRILVMQDGRIVESGAHQQLLDSQGLYHRLYNLQFGGVNA